MSLSPVFSNNESIVVSSSLKIEPNIYGLDSLGMAAVFVSIENSSNGAIINLTRANQTDGIAENGITRTTTSIVGLPFIEGGLYNTCVFLLVESKLACTESRFHSFEKIREVYLLFRN